VFAGNDVAETLDLRDSSHLDKSLDAIKPGVKDNNIPAGLFAGANEATDISTLAQDRFDDANSDYGGMRVGSGVGGAAVIWAGGMSVGACRGDKTKRIAQARAEISLVDKEYGGLASRLDDFDIRAHSLTSPFADNTMRSNWESVRLRFFEIHNLVDA